MNKNLFFLLGLAIVVLICVTTFILLEHNSQSTVMTTDQHFATSSSVASSTPSSPQIPLWGEYHINAPNALMLVDAQGRRTGKDPVAGMLYREIPNTSYGEETGTPGHRSGELFTSNLPNGQYTLYVLGGQSGSYTLDASHYGQPDQTFRGNIQVGTMIAYVQNYDTAHLASSTFSFASAASSTASITSVPPHNLPPPPVP